MELYKADAFSLRSSGQAGWEPTGNPAAICLVPVDTELSEQQMQRIASEINLSETTFVQPLSEGQEEDEETQRWSSDKVFSIRWFTPTTEVKLCGHATLAAAGVLLRVKENGNAEIEFRSLSGPLFVSVDQDDHDAVSMRFPRNPPTPVEITSSLQEIIDYTVGDLPCQEVLHSSATNKLIIRLNDEVTLDALQTMSPNTDALLRVDQSAVDDRMKVQGVSVTLKSTSRAFDFCSRYFSPWNGIPEDPVNGSSHTVLGPYWGQTLSRSTLRALQASRRGGDLRIKMTSSATILSGRISISFGGILNAR
eukprot:gb/GECG01001713.1/.p1 GENE.gb/GECG01001713.1/~~gb/GECG01001713.1/.p1  ORF type:complete len:308 (+),score=34.14 gb/GECG01001713.1/:1-924(+)